MERVPAALSSDPIGRAERRVGAPTSPGVVRALALQRAAGNRATGRILARAWLPQASKGGGKGIANTNKDMRKDMAGLIGSMANMAAGAGTMAEGDGYRIDYQGGVTGRPGWVNVQVQGGNRSFAGVLCPSTLPLATIREGLRLSMAAGQLMVWHPDDDEAADEKPQPKKKQPPKGGGKGSGKGSGFRAPTAVH